MYRNDDVSVRSGRSSSIERLPRRTAGIYAAGAVTWILGSDLVVTVAGGGTAREFAMNASKGLLFVAVTTPLLWVVLGRWATRTAIGWKQADHERRRFESLVHGSSDVIGVFGDDGLLTYVSPSIQRVLGWTPDDVLGARGRVLLHPDERDAAFEYLDAIRAGTAPRRPQIFRVLTPEGGWRTLEILARDLSLEPSVGGVVVHGRDITERRRAESRLDDALNSDPVTGVASRTRFEADLRDAALAAEARGQYLAMLVVDLDGFREINRAVGRRGGDDVLREVATRLGGAVHTLSLGRLGADEFGLAVAVTGDGRKAVEQTERAARALIEAVSLPIFALGQRLRLAAVVGGAVVPLPGSVEEGLLVAETNLREAKSHPDRVVIGASMPGTGSHISGAQLASDLHDAIDRDQLRLHYQTQHDVATGEVVGVEALIRWQHPTEGLVGPGTFLGVARGLLLAGITQFAVREATLQAARWQSQGRRVSVSVNLSPTDLRRAGFVDEVLEALVLSGADPTLLCLELTEQALLTELDRSLMTMRVLREEGICFAIDDFGTGYSSLAHLRTLPVDQVKVDQSFIARMATDEADDAIVSTIVDLGQRLGLTVVAEGIEDHATCSRLAAIGCDQSQGYLFSRPVSPDEVDFSCFDVTTCSSRTASAAGAASPTSSLR